MSNDHRAGKALLTPILPYEAVVEANGHQDAWTYAESIVETVPEPLVVLDAGLKVKTANRSFYQTFRVTPAETENRILFDLGNGQWNIPALRKVLEEILSRDTAFQDFEVEHSFPDIGHKIMRVNGRRVYREGKPTETVLFAIEDITVRSQAARALKTSEVRYRRLFEAARDGILILNVDSGKIVDANPFMFELLGCGPDYFQGKELWEIGLFEDIEASRAAFRELREKGYIRYENLSLVTTAGRQAEVEFVSNVYGSGREQVIQCNIRDITARRRTEGALKEADRRKDDFLAMLAHELRNPLAPIRNSVQVLQVVGSTDEKVEWAREVIDRQVQQLTRLVDDLMDVSRITCGKLNLRLEPVELATVVARAIEISRSLMEARKHQLHVALPGQALRVQGDSVRLAQILSNLLNNAAKYTEEGGRIELTVEKAPCPLGEEAGEALIRVRDTGLGIAAEMLPKVFDLYSQMDRTLKHAQGGLGLGLTLVRRLAEMHGGSVAAFSDGPGQGSEFVVYLPLLTETTASRTTKVAKQKAHREVATRRILVVDDNRDAADSLALLLRLQGHKVHAAHAGPAALDIARTSRFDVALLDINMPEMDGLELAQRLRQDPGMKQTLLVALTGYGGEEDRHRSLDAGFNAHLVKPVDMETLSGVLAQAEADVPNGAGG